MALVHQLLHGGRPAHGAAHLVLQHIADVVRPFHHAGFIVAVDGHGRRAEGAILEFLRQLHHGAVHQAGMVGSRHIELLGDLAAGSLGSGNGLVHAFFRAGNDRLAGAVEVGNVHVAFLRQLLQRYRFRQPHEP